MNIKDTALFIAAHHFGFDQKPAIETLTSGRVNDSFLIQNKSEKFVLQRMHPVFGGTGDVVENVQAMTNTLSSGGMTVPEILQTSNGKLWARHEERIWRLLSFVPGRPPAERTPDIIARVAEALGTAHHILAADPPKLKTLPAAEHNADSPSPSSAWDQLINKYRHDPKFAKAEDIINQGRSLAMSLPEIRPDTVTTLHGDPKLDNFLFDHSGKFTALIDFDSARTGSLIWELADGLRSWCAMKNEKGFLVFDLNLFETALKSYREHGLELSGRELYLLPIAAKAKALNLGRRYLKDYFDENYFQWELIYPSLAEQNLQRGLANINLAAS